MPFTDEDLVEAIYAGMASPELLQQALIIALERIGAHGGNFHIISKRDLRSVLFLGRGPNYTDANIDAYLGHWRHINIHRILMRSKAPIIGDGVFVCDEHIDRETLAKSAYLNEFYFPIGERWLAGAVAYDDADYEVSLVFNRGPDQTAFGLRERLLVAPALRHVRRAAVLALRMAQQNPPQTGFAESLARAEQAALLVDGRARVLWRNCSAQTLLEEQSVVMVRNERLEFSPASAGDQFKRLLQAALNRSFAATGAEALRLSSETRSFKVEALPANVPRGGIFGAEAAALVIVSEAKLDARIDLRLQRDFGLTKAEARLAVALAEGQSVEEIASASRRSKTTLRAQLREIFAKAGVTRQGALIAKIWRLGA
jgi:DNA-binding CsgD family transcriptional regulator